MTTLIDIKHTLDLHPRDQRNILDLRCPACHTVNCSQRTRFSVPLARHIHTH